MPSLERTNALPGYPILNFKNERPRMIFTSCTQTHRPLSFKTNPVAAAIETITAQSTKKFTG
jgi:hypothetical protein